MSFELWKDRLNLLLWKLLHFIFKLRGIKRRWRKVVQIELTDGDRDMLRGVLQKHLTELSFEIAFTQRKDSTGFLQKRKEFIEGFIQRLDG
jgi:hypothetical protein